MSEEKSNINAAEDVKNSINNIETDDTKKVYTLQHFSIFEFDIINDIKAFIKRFYKKMFIIAGIVTVVVLVWIALININTSSMVITFKHDAMGSGRNPDGSRFNIYEVVSDDVLNAVVKDLDNEWLTIDYLKNHLVVQDRVSAAKQANIEQSILDGYESYSYLPNEFSVSYSQLLGPVRAGRILVSLMTSYNDYFVKNHIDKAVVLNPDLSEIANLDYLNGAEKISLQLECMQLYLNKRQNENDKFVSESTGKSFNDIISVINSILNEDLTTYRSYVIKSSLSKDPQSLYTQYYYSIKNMQNEYTSTKHEYDVASEALEIYDQNVTKFVFIPTIDEEGDYYMSRTNTGIDYLVKMADNDKHDMQDILTRIDNANYILSNYANGEQTDASVKLVADAMLDGIVKRINEMSQLAVKTEEDYQRFSKNAYPTFSISRFGIGMSANIRYFIIGVFFSLLIGAILIYTVEKIKKYYKKYNHLIFDKFTFLKKFKKDEKEVKE